MFEIFTQVPVTECFSVGHVFRKQTCGHHKYSTLTSCDVRLHTATSSITCAIPANNPPNEDIEKNSLEE